MLSLLWGPECLLCFYFPSCLQGSDDSDMCTAWFSCGGVKTVHSGFRVTPRVASGRCPLLCCAQECPWKTAQGEMCQDLAAFKAFICKYGFDPVLLVLWALKFNKDDRGGKKERQRRKYEKEKMKQVSVSIFKHKGISIQTKF